MTEMYKNSSETENWAFTALRSISEGVIATDKNGSITFMNPVAEAQMGVMFTEAMGKALKNMISFKDEKGIVVSDTNSSTAPKISVCHLRQSKISTEDYLWSMALWL